MFEQPETQPTSVSPTPVADAAKQVGDVRDRWSWTEPCAWTERMLAALESGVKNSFFTEHGLFSLKTAHVLACQSSPR